MTLDLRGWFSEAEGAWYRDAVAQTSGAVVEVGVWRGRSVSFIASVLGERPLICVDHWRGSTDAWDTAYKASLAASEAEGEGVRASFERNMAALGLRPRVLAMLSVDAAAQVDDGTCGLVFIDASHDGPAVRADLEAWWPKVRADGTLAGHDYEPGKHPQLVAEVDAFAHRMGLPLQRGPERIWWLRRS